jgi:hypothetical protein
VASEGTVEVSDDILPPYTLADAMREGSMMGDQAFKTFEGPEGATCALGAAHAALKSRGIV